MDLYFFKKSIIKFLKQNCVAIRLAIFLLSNLTLAKILRPQTPVLCIWKDRRCFTMYLNLNPFICNYELKKQQQQNKQKLTSHLQGHSMPIFSSEGEVLWTPFEAQNHVSTLTLGLTQDTGTPGNVLFSYPDLQGSVGRKCWSSCSEVLQPTMGSLLLVSRLSWTFRHQGLSLNSSSERRFWTQGHWLPLSSFLSSCNQDTSLRSLCLGIFRMIISMRNTSWLSGPV